MKSISYLMLVVTMLAGCSSKRQISLTESSTLDTSTIDSIVTQDTRTSLAQSVFTKAWTVDSPAITITMTDGTIIDVRALRASHNAAGSTISESRDSLSIKSVKHDSITAISDRSMAETQQRQSGDSTIPIAIFFSVAAITFIILKFKKLKK